MRILARPTIMRGWGCWWNCRKPAWAHRVRVVARLSANRCSDLRGPRRARQPAFLLPPASKNVAMGGPSDRRGTVRGRLGPHAAPSAAERGIGITTATCGRSLTACAPACLRALARLRILSLALTLAPGLALTLALGLAPTLGAGAAATRRSAVGALPHA